MIRFPDRDQIKIAKIACGGEHILVLSESYEVYAWGRNNDGQLGAGYISEYEFRPVFIKEMLTKNIGFVACGEDYSSLIG